MIYRSRRRLSHLAADRGMTTDYRRGSSRKEEGRGVYLPRLARHGPGWHLAAVSVGHGTSLPDGTPVG